LFLISFSIWFFYLKWCAFPKIFSN
jgi:hypothetical protein